MKLELMVCYELDCLLISLANFADFADPTGYNLFMYVIYLYIYLCICFCMYVFECVVCICKCCQ